MKSTAPSGDTWYERAFGSDYVKRYAHRDAGEARLAVESLVAPVAHAASARALDLCCGAGRHSAEMSRLGWNVVSYDLSAPLLRIASERFHAEHRPFAPVRGDMRVLPFADRSFTLVASFFTSFGYFADDCENARVLNEASRVLAPGGTMILDFLNRETTLAKIAATPPGGEATFQLVDGRILEKTVPAASANEPPLVERLRLYAPDELLALASEAGLAATTRFGNYNRAEFNSATSDRCITLFSKPL